MRIAFIWFWDRASGIRPKWRDGLRSAIEIVGKKHEVDWFLDKAWPHPEDNYDFLLFWSSSQEDYFPFLHQYKARKGLCLTTDPHNVENLRKLDVIFAESRPIYDACRMQGLRTIRAFGTDTEFFKPNIWTTKDIEYFYPATFSPWKRQSAIAHLGKKLLCVGTIQPDGQEEYEACKKAGVRTEVGYFPVKKIKKYYDRAEKVIIPAVHGSERTILEAMSMNILPEVSHPLNKRAKSYLSEYEDWFKKRPPKKAETMAHNYSHPRPFILENYSHFKYAEDLLRGIEE